MLKAFIINNARNQSLVACYEIHSTSETSRFQRKYNVYIGNFTTAYLKRRLIYINLQLYYSTYLYIVCLYASIRYDLRSRSHVKLYHAFLICLYTFHLPLYQLLIQKGFNSCYKDVLNCNWLFFCFFKLSSKFKIGTTVL